MELRPFETYRGDVHLFVAGPLVVVDFTASPRTGAWDEVARVQTHAYESYGRVCVLTVGEGPPMWGQAAEQLASLEAVTLGRATVLPGAGLLRTVLGSVHLPTAAHAPSRCFNALGPAVRWLQSLPGQLEPVKRVCADDVSRALASVVGLSRAA